MNEKELVSLVVASRAGDMDSYAVIVRRFQDMAYGYAYAILGDFHLAEDIAQEAFVEAYYNLSRLQDAAAFPGWFRQIVRYKCSRFMRGKNVATMPLDKAHEIQSIGPGPHEAIEKQEIKDSIARAIRSLSQPLREVTTLFYINGYSHHEISGFLDVPVNTVKSRLNSSRKKLKERMIAMVKETFDEHKLADDFARKVIEGVPRVGFYSGGKNCPESYPFPSCLSACLKSMGQDYGSKEITVHDSTWHLNNGYVYIMGTSGEAFRLFFKPGWHLDNVGIIGEEPDAKEFIDRAFEAVGYAYRFVTRDPKKPKSGKLLRESIIKSIRDYGRPIIGFGVIGPPECSIITGYDDKGQVLIGWSFFQSAPDFSAGVDLEPSGYFRKRDWLKDTWGIIIIGEKKQAPARGEIYRKALRRAVELTRKPKIHLGGERHNGLAAYTAWAEAITKDEDFPAKDMSVLRERHMSHDNMVGMVAEGRWYASHFLRQVAENETDMAENLSAAIDCYEAEHSLMWKIWGLVGGIGRSDEKVKKFAEPEIRRQIAPIILEARDKDAKAADYIEKVLAK
jgi:RNA polymerase sigma factor (sigma-70 family)